jgi:hypothetical protein
MASLKKHWVRTDPWRGYYEYDNSVLGGSILAGYGDPYAESQNKEEKERIKKAKSILRKSKIPYKVAHARTSNVFSQVYDIVVDKENVTKAEKLLKAII